MVVGVFLGIVLDFLFEVGGFLVILIVFLSLFVVCLERVEFVVVFGLGVVVLEFVIGWFVSFVDFLGGMV